MKDFSYYFAQLRKIEDHREQQAEKEIRKLYKELLKETKHFLAEGYEQLAEEGKLTYEVLRAKGQDVRFLAEVEQRLNDLSPKVSQEIRQLVEELYETAFVSMEQIAQYALDEEEIKWYFGEGKPTADTVRAMADNPIAGLTLNDTLEKNRRNIIWDIKREIGIGLTVGDRYETMAKRIARSLDSDYKKAIRIVRTEAGRVREKAHLDAALEINNVLQESDLNKKLVKTWKTMKDGSVRPNGQKKATYDHVKMEGVTVGADEDFVMPDGTKMKAPKQSGVAGHDINCRCFAKYDLVTIQAAKVIEQSGKGETSEYYWHARYGAGFTKEEVKEILKPSMEGMYEEQKVQFMNKLMKGRKIERDAFISNMDKFAYETVTRADDGAWYDPRNGKITINMATQEKNPRGSYATIFHEAGHWLDNYCWQKQAADWQSTVDTKFYNALFKDAKAWVDDAMKRYESDNKDYVRMKVYGELSGGMNSSVSDLMRGLTRNTVQFGGNYGHKADYYGKESIAKEAFAHFFEANIVGGERREKMYGMFPNAGKLYDKMIEELSEEMFK